MRKSTRLGIVGAVAALTIGGTSLALASTAGSSGVTPTPSSSVSPDTTTLSTISQVLAMPRVVLASTPASGITCTDATSPLSFLQGNISLTAATAAAVQSAALPTGDAAITAALTAGGLRQTTVTSTATAFPAFATYRGLSSGSTNAPTWIIMVNHALVLSSGGPKIFNRPQPPLRVFTHLMFLVNARTGQNELYFGC